jgi:hypothetical protein
MILSAVIVALNRMLLGETHRHANAGYKLIAAPRMEKGSQAHEPSPTDKFKQWLRNLT